MYFHNWLKNKSKEYGREFVTRSDVEKYLENVDHPKAKEILKECRNSTGVEWIPIGVWEDEYYNFKVERTLPIKYENEYKGRTFVTYASCCHCGFSAKLSEFTHVLTDPTEGLIFCPNKDCADHDEGVFLRIERK